MSEPTNGGAMSTYNNPSRQNHVKIWLEAIITDTDQNKEFLEIKFAKPPEDEGSIVVPRSYRFDVMRVASMLADAGAYLPQSSEILKDMLKKVLAADTVRRTSVTRKCGWTERGIYVHPAWDNPDDISVIYSTTIKKDDFLAGKTCRWRDGLSEAFKRSSFLTVAAGAAYAGAILRLSGQEGAILHFSGESSTGKSLALRTAQSVSRRARPQDLFTFDSSSRGLEERCRSCNDSLIAIDELGRNGSGTAKLNIKEIAFKITSGTGRTVSEQYNEQNNINTDKWSTFGVSSGERLLDQDIHRERGEQLRLIDIAVPSGRTGGIFDMLSEGENSGTFAAQVEQVIEKNYGRPLKRFVEHISKNQAQVKTEIERHRQKFISLSANPDNAWEARFANKFGLIYAAMVLAAEAKAAPWDQKHALKCARKVYRKALATIIDMERETDNLIADLRKSASEGKIPGLSEFKALSEESKKSVWGIMKECPQHGTIVALDKDILLRRFPSKAHLRRCREILDSRGLLVTDQMGFDLQISVKG